MPGRHPEKAQRSFSIRTDDVQMRPDRFTRLASKCTAIGGLPNCLCRPGYEGEILMRPRLGDDGAQGANRGLGPRAWTPRPESSAQLLDPHR